jgi:hypothetical protein
MRNALDGVTDAAVRSTVDRRGQIDRVARQQKGILAGELLPDHLWLGENTFPVRVDRFTRGALLFVANTGVEIARFEVDPVLFFRLDYIAVQTSNFTAGLDDEDVEYRVTSNGTPIRPFDRWLGLVTPLDFPRRQQSNFKFPPGSLIQFWARVLSPIEGGPSTAGGFDVHAQLVGSMVTS